AAFRFTSPPFTNVTTKDDNITVSAMSMTTGSMVTNNSGTYFPDLPYAQSSGGWTVDNQAAAKAFQFTITPGVGYSVTITGISFRAYATSAGPSALGYDIGSGAATYAMNITNAALLEVTQVVAGVDNQSAAVAVLIQGWTNGTRLTSGSGDFRLDDVVIFGTVSGAGVPDVKFTASADSADEGDGTYDVTVFKTLAEGNVSGEIGLSGTATEGAGADYTVDTTNFTLNGATTSATFTVTINDDAETESAETVILTLANVVGGTAVSPSVFTLTINDNDVVPPPEPEVMRFVMPAGGTATATLTTSVESETYALEYTPALIPDPPVWTEVDTEVGTGDQISLADPTPASGQRIYRVVIK
ncbi:MAG: hypothetical protein KKC51_10845, partial [Verrucomicrobia bacterium]|nr:hypothetical protein [Verrucomicrobiota bacterium]